MKRTITSLAAIAALTAGASAATTIGFNFTGNWTNTRIDGAMADGTDQWTDSVDASSASGTQPANSTDDYAVTTTTASGVTVAWSSHNMYIAGAEANKDQAIYRVYLDDGGDGPTVTITGLSQWLTANNADGYKLTVYRSTDVADNMFAQLDFYSGEGTGGTLLESISPELAAGDGSYPTGSGEGGSRLKQETTNVFTDDVITFHSEYGLGEGGYRGGIAGFKITIVPEPSSVALLGLGGLALILRRRK